MNERLALLRAILASPDEDTPRLMFADWLNEYGTTDADAARSEFIRLGCTMKRGKRPITAKEGEWVVSNWRRILPSVPALTTPDRMGTPRRKGRWLEMLLGWPGFGSEFLYLEFDRGFVRRVGFETRPSYAHYWGAIAAEEPVAEFCPNGLPRVSVREMRRKEVVVYPDDWGEAVFARVAGFDSELPARWKQFTTRPHLDRTPPAEWDPQHRARAALTAAMTAIARETNGLTPPPETA